MSDRKDNFKFSKAIMSHLIPQWRSTLHVEICNVYRILLVTGIITVYTTQWFYNVCDLLWMVLNFLKSKDEEIKLLSFTALQFFKQNLQEIYLLYPWIQIPLLFSYFDILWSCLHMIFLEVSNLFSLVNILYLQPRMNLWIKKWDLVWLDVHILCPLYEYTTFSFYAWNKNIVFLRSCTQAKLQGSGMSKRHTFFH